MTTAPRSYDVVEVTVNLESQVLSNYTQALFENLENAVVSRGGQLTFSNEELLEYVQSLIAARIGYVTHTDITVRPMDNVCVPSYIAVLLSNIGKAVDHGLGVELVPASVKSPLTKDEIISFSRKLVSLSNFGFEYSDGYSRDKFGSWDFMAMTLIEDEVLRHDNVAHPVYALLAATVGLKGVESALSPRVTYGSSNHLAQLVSAVATLK
jgi:hypothetical protein